MTTPASACPKCGHSFVSVPLITPLPKDRIHRLLRTNDYLSDEDESMLQSFISNAPSKLSHLEARIVLVKALLDELETAKEDIRMAFSKRKKLLNPMRRMPEDLLVEIFLHGVGYYTDPEEYFLAAKHSLDLGSPPWTYGRVCHRWKEIAIQTPLLWTRVKVEMKNITSFWRHKVNIMSTSNVPRLPFGLSLLSLYLGRSAALPLSIYVDVPANCFSSSDDLAYGISVLMASYSRRWESLFLGKGQGFNMMFAEDSFPMLRTLRVQDDSDDTPTVIDIPALRLKSWSTPDHRLLNLHGLMSGSFEDRSTASSFAEIGRFNPVNLPGLRELVLDHRPTKTSAELKAPKTFLDSLTCLALVLLSVVTYGSQKSTIQGFEKRSAFKLERLDITGQTEIFDGGTQNNAYLKSLVIRSIGETANYGSFVSVQNVLSSLEPHAASLGSSSMAPFPAFRRLELHFSPYSVETWDTIEALFLCVSSRLSCANTAEYDKLSPIEVLITAPDGQARKMLDHPRLGELRLLGMKINIVAL
ncbi:hypothetical protein J3R30DRAFT_3881097 [Lentinula aciculospora]|uniref:F-box domain-containing protein n=1 Tax=Lentinula aciculospora TaxID=153920 RepID=A0A9W9DNF2_9AGAR|nr:hypothetical protein J3R30DRAFT_3881097 [Lentinula aciculospora]